MEFSDVTAQHIEAETQRVVATAASFRNDAILAPSLCPGWSRGHVLTHLARNADALGRVCDVATTGRADTMYDDAETRDAEIEAGSRRSATDLAEDIRDSAARLAPRLAAVRPEHRGIRVERTPGGPHIPVEKVAFMRLRELVFHHIDLDAGYGFEHLSPDLVQLFLDDAVKRLRHDDAAPSMTITSDEGDEYVVGDGEARVSGRRAALLLWLARERGEGLVGPSPLPTLPFGG